MNKLNITFLAAALACAALASAQTETQPAAPPDSRTATEPQVQQPAEEPTPGTASPLPSTSPTEGTAADTTPPGETAGPGEIPSPDQAAAQTPDEMPADSTTGARMAAAAGMGGQSASKMIGATVQDPSGETVGTVQDVVIDTSGQVSLVVTPGGMSSAAGESSTIPWDAVQSVAPDGRVTVDSSRMNSESDMR